MFLVSVKCEYENEIKGKLKSLYNKKVTIFAECDILEHNKYKNYNYVITDYNKDVITYFLNEKKIIIVMDSNKDNSKLKDDNIYYCTDINEIQDVIKENGLKNNSPIKIAAAVMMLITLISILTISLQNKINMKTNNSKNEANEIQENTESKIKIEKKESKKANDIKAQNYVFLGDSITEFYHLEDYYDGNIPVVNSGIAGNKAYEILGDVENRVYKYNPTKVFLLVGTNDLSHRSDEEIVNDITGIVKKIHKNRKKTEVYVESIYPVNNNTEDNDKVINWMVGDRDNERIKKINDILKEKSEEFNYTYLDFYSKLEGEDGLLKIDYTVDGLHISDEGYKVITKEIMKIIEGEGNE